MFLSARTTPIAQTNNPPHKHNFLESQIHTIQSPSSFLTPHTYLHHLQLLQPPLNQLLHLPLPQRLSMVLPKGVFRPSPGVLAEIVSCKLGGLAEEGAELMLLEN